MDYPPPGLGIERALVQGQGRLAHHLGKGGMAVDDAGIGVAPVLDIDQILGPANECALADWLLWRLVGCFVAEAVRQLFQHPGWDGFALAGIDETEHDEVRQQYPPIRPKPRQQPLPVDIAGGAADEVGDIPAVEALPSTRLFLPRDRAAPAYRRRAR